MKHSRGSPRSAKGSSASASTGEEAPRLLGPLQTRDLLTRHGLRPRASMGQHFVVDANTVRKVVRLAGVSPGDLVLEVGPGAGALTLALVSAGARVRAVELDRSLQPVLAETVGALASVEWADALSVAGICGGESKMVSNLPYNIATPLVLRLLAECPAIASQTFMVQREVGERLVALPGTHSYGAVSAKVAYFAAASVAAQVSRRAFWPVPAVDSVIVRLVRRSPPVPVSQERLWPVIEAGFAQRRKTIRNALRGAGIPSGLVSEALERAGISPGERAERLGLPEFAAIADALPDGAL